LLIDRAGGAMRDQQRGANERAGSADRKTRQKGDTVYHTTRGGIYHGDVAERPRGLTTEQAESQRVGSKIDERQVREAAHGERQATEWGNPAERQPEPGEGRRHQTDELTAARSGTKRSRK
jgi:hypothetical protein